MVGCKTINCLHLESILSYFCLSFNWFESKLLVIRIFTDFNNHVEIVNASRKNQQSHAGKVLFLFSF